MSLPPHRSALTLCSVLCLVSFKSLFVFIRKRLSVCLHAVLYVSICFLLSTHASLCVFSLLFLCPTRPSVFISLETTRNEAYYKLSLSPDLCYSFLHPTFPGSLIDLSGIINSTHRAHAFTAFNNRYFKSF